MNRQLNGAAVLLAMIAWPAMAASDERQDWRAVSDIEPQKVTVADSLRVKAIETVSTAFLALGQSGRIVLNGKPYVLTVSGSGKEEASKNDDGHRHAHDHGDDQIYKGYFDDAQVKDRALSDWEGDWQSVYPYLQDGTLDTVMAHKAEDGKQSVAEYKAYYEIGYRTDVERITIEGDNVTFFKEGKPIKACYVSDGREILTYEKGNRGVRFIFRKAEGDADAPEYFQFSDHKIAPAKADHYHLYWGDDRAALLKEVTNWPTYYPSALSAKEIVSEMLAH